MPARRSASRPEPATWSSGSAMPTTTRATPAAMIASVHGGVRPWCEHGSSVQTSVAPRAASPAASSATISAWRPPGGSVAPVAIRAPSGDNSTAPTHGFGEVRARTAAAASIAALIAVVSSISMDLLRAVPFRDAGNGNSTTTAPRPVVDASRHRRAPAPIRTVTVGPGVPPDRPTVDSTMGSRAFTAGRDFHPTPQVFSCGDDASGRLRATADRATRSLLYSARWAS